VKKESFHDTLCKSMSLEKGCLNFITGILLYGLFSYPWENPGLSLLKVNSLENLSY